MRAARGGGAWAQSDLQTLDRIRPPMDRLQRLAERGRFTEMGVGADILAAALEGYKLLRVSGRSQGLEGLSKELGESWARPSRAVDEDEDEDAQEPSAV